MVATLAGKPLTEVHLVRAVENRDERVEAYSYLQRIAKQLPAGLNVQLDVPIGEPGGAIQEAAQWLDPGDHDNPRSLGLRPVPPREHCGAGDPGAADANPARPGCCQ